MGLIAGWIVAVLATGVAFWLWRLLAAERLHTSELLYSKLDLENELDVLRVDSTQDVAAAAAAAGQSVSGIAHELHVPLTSIGEHLRHTQTDLEDYRAKVREFDAAVQYCLQPVELILGADKASLAELVSHVEGARRKLFETRSAVENNRLHKNAGALDDVLAELDALAEHADSLIRAHAPTAAVRESAEHRPDELQAVGAN